MKVLRPSGREVAIAISALDCDNDHPRDVSSAAQIVDNPYRCNEVPVQRQRPVEICPVSRLRHLLSGLGPRL